VQAQLDAAVDDAAQLKELLDAKSAEVGELAAQFSAAEADGGGDERDASEDKDGARAAAQQQQVSELESEISLAVATARSAEAAHVAQLKALRDELVAGRAEVEATHGEAKRELAAQLEASAAKLAQTVAQKEALASELAAATAAAAESAQHERSALSKQKRVFTKRAEKQVAVIKTWAKERCGSLTQTIAEAHAELERERAKLAAEHATSEAAVEELASSKAEAQHTLRHIEAVRRATSLRVAAPSKRLLQSSLLSSPRSIQPSPCSRSAPLFTLSLRYRYRSRPPPRGCLSSAH
jgi:hypothetical protein